jgi:phage shock protein E
MNWTLILMIVAVVGALIWMKTVGQISGAEALARLKAGALVIDVRSPGEFNSGHLRSAVNIPLGELETGVPKQVKDKDQVLLLHCASGARSALGVKKLKGLGYANVFNLGSYGRADSILRQAR